MLRLLGGLLLTGGGLAAGLSAAGELSQRLEELRAWGALLGEMERAMAYALPPLPDLLVDLAGRAKEPQKGALEAARAGLDGLGEYSFGEIWAGALRAHKGALEGEDLACLLTLGAALGRWDGETQCRAMAAAREALEENALRLRRRLDREGRVYGMVGLSAGAFLTILLL